MKYFEIIGPSGSGKTTVFSYLRKRKNLSYCRVNGKRIFFFLLENNKLDTKRKFLFQCYFFLQPKKAINRLISRLYQVHFQFQTSLIQKYGLLYFNLLEGLKKENPIYVNQVLTDYLNVLKFIHVASLCYDKEEIIFMDEGLIHKNSSLRNINFSLGSNVSEFLKKNIEGVVYLKSDKNKVFDRAFSRLESGKKTLSHKFLDIDSLKYFSYNQYESYLVFKEYLKEIDIPILEVHSDEEIEKLEKQIDCFIKGKI